MPFEIIRNDITRVKADVIVNSANPLPKVGRGSEAGIYMAAGWEKLLSSRKKIGPIPTGEARPSPAYKLPAKYLVHTVAPRWMGGDEGERELLRSCYKNSMDLALSLSARSLAVPLLGTGFYDWPREEAMAIALDEIQRFLLLHDMKITLVVLDEESYGLSGKLFGDIQAYIDEHEAADIHRRERFRFFSFWSEAEIGGGGRKEENIPHFSIGREAEEEEERPEGFKEAEEDDWEGEEALEEPHFMLSQAPAGAPSYEKAREEIHSILSIQEETFQQRLLRLIDERGMKDSVIYKKANVDRRLFAKIRRDEGYHPSKKTAVALAIALELRMDDMQDLLRRAEFALSPSNKFDLIISYFVSREIYDVYTINLALFEYKQPLLGE